MEREIYHAMRALQREHWWFIGRRRVLDALIDSLRLRPAAKILEAGAGSGGNMGLLSRHGEVSAFEMDAEVARFCTEDTGVPCALGSRPHETPFAGCGNFDLVVALDVLEHIERDVPSLASLASCLAPDGRLLLTVPAYGWLHSGHDDVHHHVRRYTRAGLERAVGEAGMDVERAGYFNSFLLPIVAAVRLASRLLERDAASDTRMPSASVNALLARIFGAEAPVVRWAGFPAGVSVFLIARRRGAI
jgi:SAM-dependent methyltransferase